MHVNTTSSFYYLIKFYFILFRCHGFVFASKVISNRNNHPRVCQKFVMVVSFLPNYHNQLTYCPIHLSFVIGKNLELENYEKPEEKKNPLGFNGNSSKEVKLSADGSWAQDYYLKNKVFSNTQKINFTYHGRKSLM